MTGAPETTIYGPAEAGHVRLERLGDGVARVVLAQEARLNAINAAMWDGLVAAMDAVARDGDLRAVILTGAGARAFSAGADLSEFGEKRSDPEATAGYNAKVRAGMAAVRTAEVPVLAAIRGKCIGAGVALAAMADLRIADAACDFGIPAAKLGVAYDPDWVARLVAVAGRETVSALLLFGARIKGGEARAAGLVSGLYGPDDLDGEALALARAAAAGAPLSHRATKAALAAALPLVSPEAHALARTLAAACDESPEYRQSVHDFTQDKTS